MSTIVEVDRAGSSVTDGRIAAINLESARRRAWARFAQDPRRAGVAEDIVDMEHLAAQFLGDLDALDRLDALASQFAQADDSSRADLVGAKVASTVHRFADAREHLAHAARKGATREVVEPQSLTIDQACGVGLYAVLAARRRIAMASGRIEDLVPFGAVLADLDRFAEADAAYRQAFRSYHGISPFPLAWVCFQLGVLWGELDPEPIPDLAALWYRRAIACLPDYVKARVHLAEVYASRGRTDDAETLLLPMLSSRDPEVRWRLADVLLAQKRVEDAEVQRDAVRRGFDELLERHLLAFADHAADFYAGIGNDCGRALALARTNVENRPNRRALEQVKAIAGKGGESGAACEQAGSMSTVTLRPTPETPPSQWVRTLRQ